MSHMVTGYWVARTTNEGCQMRKLVCVCCIMAVFLLCLLAGCQKEPDEDNKAFLFYQQYRVELNKDPVAAIKKYKYYDDPIALQLALDNAQAAVEEYEILNFKKLCDKLWVVEVSVSNSHYPDIREYVNFIAEIDGKLRVVANVYMLPDEFKEQIHVEDYTTPDYMHIVGKDR